MSDFVTHGSGPRTTLRVPISSRVHPAAQRDKAGISATQRGSWQPEKACTCDVFGRVGSRRDIAVSGFASRRSRVRSPYAPLGFGVSGSADPALIPQQERFKPRPVSLEAVSPMVRAEA